MEAFKLITLDPEVMGGKPCIRDTRITVSLILNLLSNGKSNEEIIDDYPELTREDILAVNEYAL